MTTADMLTDIGTVRKIADGWENVSDAVYDALTDALEAMESFEEACAAAGLVGEADD